MISATWREIIKENKEFLALNPSPLAHLVGGTPTKNSITLVDTKPSMSIRIVGIDTRSIGSTKGEIVGAIPKITGI